MSTPKLPRSQANPPQAAFAGKLTTWAAGSDSPIVHFIRTTPDPLLLILFTPPAAIIF